MTNLTEEDAKFITENIVAPCLNEYSKSMIESLLKRDDGILDINEMIVDKLSDRINELEFNNIKNTSFIKAVLFAHKLSNEECYQQYIEEWDRLNRHIIEKEE